MKIIIIFFALLVAFISYAQVEVNDKIELKNGKIYLGKVDKIKTDFVEFKESETGLIYEYSKNDIRYIQLSNGKVLTFDDYSKTEEKSQPQNTKEAPVVIQESGPNVGLIILASVGAVLLVLILIGAAAR
jgi:hypothetical protein